MKVRRCVIPLAGLGSRLYPATKVVPKALFPVLDGQGLARPLIHVLIQEARSAGMEALALVVQPAQIALVRSYFEDPPASGILDDARLKEETESIMKMGQAIQWIVQETPLGFGDAVFRARDFAGEDPFLLMLGDHLFTSNQTRSCAAQICQAFERYGQSMMGVCVVDREDLSRVASIEGSPAGPRAYRVQVVTEKPGPDWPHLHPMEGLPPGSALGAFGMDVMTPEVFVALARLAQGSTSLRQEIQLRDAQDLLAQSGRLMAYHVDGCRHDTGEPALYAAHLSVLRKKTVDLADTRLQPQPPLKR